MNQKERMLAGLPYKAWLDGLSEERTENKLRIYEYGIGITIGDNVWVGGSVVLNPEVHIGNNVIIGSGSVVTKDIPANIIAAGNPCKVIREITEEDRRYYYKNNEFDVDDYNI